MSEKAQVDLRSQIFKMNLAERDELQRLGYEITEDGDVLIPQKKPGLLKRLLDSVRESYRSEFHPQRPRGESANAGMSRADFLRTLTVAAFVGTGLTELVAAPQVKAMEDPEDELLQAEVDGQAESELRSEIESILERRTGGFSLQFRNPETKQILGRVDHNAETLLPVASAFKAFVLGAYLDLVPKEEWKIDRSSNLFNMIVYSHNLATGQLIHEVAERLRQNGSTQSDRNDLQLFNDYLQERELPRVVGSWGFNGPTEGQVDTQAFGDVSSRNKSAEVANVATPTTLTDGYTYFFDHLGSQDPVKLELFKYMLSLRDLRFLSPLEGDFLQMPLYSKDGYLTPGTFPGFGSTRVDAGCIDLPDGTQVMVSLSTFNESDVVVNQVADAVSRYIQKKCEGQSATPTFPVWSAETQDIIHERLRYRYVNDPRIDQSGAIVPQQESLAWLQSANEKVSDGEQLGGVVTVNLSTGEIAMIEVDQSKLGLADTFVGLVGERLSYGEESVQETFAASRFAEQGRYVAENGVMWHNRQGGQVPQHTMTTPMVAIVDSVSSMAGFGDLNTVTPVPFLVMKVLTGNESDGFSLTELNSEVTIHAMPELPASDPGFQHYSSRRELTEKVNSLYADGVPIQDGHDPYWSHGCVNVLPEHFERIKQFVERLAQDGKKVAVVMSYQGITDLQQLALPKDYNLRNYPFYRGNFTAATGLSFTQISR